MTAGRWGLGAAVVALMLGTTTPARSIDFDYTTTPASGAPGTTISVSATASCSDGEARLLDPGGNRVVASGSVSSSGSVTVPAGTRNGAHRILLRCGSDYLAPTRSFLVDGGTDPAVRLAGPSRIATAVAISQDLHPEDQGAEAVVLARFDSYADALAGSPLAERLGAPFLLTGSATLDPATGTELARVLAPGGTVHVLGGRAAVGDGVAAAIDALGFGVVRYAGTNRYDTAVRVARTFGRPGAVLLATGTDFRDGLVAGVASTRAGTFGPGVLLLTNGRTLPPETKGFLAGAGSVPTYAVGAPAAAALPSAVPLVGPDPSATSAKVAAQFFSAPNAVAVASSGGFADALAGGAHAAANGAPLLLTPSGSLPASVRTYLEGRRASTVIAFVYGGTGAVAEGVRAAVAAAIG